ncbi:MAG: SIS domain-containing protein [Lachnospiraceae bacterium]|nr:SIS domain-containing protein [Lachnospiraceae bacterium]
MSAINEYFDLLNEKIERIRQTQMENMEKAAQVIYKSLSTDGMVYTFGTGHGHLLALEIFYRAGGMGPVTPVMDERLMLHVDAAESSMWERRSGLVGELLEKYPIKAGDVLIAASNSGRNTVPVELVLAAKEIGACTIALTNMEHTTQVTPRNPEGINLYQAVDLVLDNCGVKGDAIWTAADGNKVGPTSTSCGAAILQAIVCRVKELSLAEGRPVDFYFSSNVDGGDEHNEVLLEKYKDIPGLCGAGWKKPAGEDAIVCMTEGEQA